MARVDAEHLEVRKASILNAAASLFARQGVGNATIQEIATEADLSAGSIYRYFPGKDELLQAYFEQCVAAGPEALMQQVTEADTPVERLQRASEIVHDKWLERGVDSFIGELEMVLAAARQPCTIGELYSAAREQLYDTIQTVVEQGQECGQIDSDFDAAALSRALHAFVYGIALMSLDKREDYDAMFDVLRGIIGKLSPDR